MDTVEQTRYAFDLDDTLCEGGTMEADYQDARPIQERVATVRRLFAGGHFIIIHTARGAMGGPQRRRRILNRTRAQLSAWGIRYHLLLPKPFAHVYVDDRAQHPDEFFQEELQHD